MAIKAVPTTKSVKKAWGTGTPGYAPGFFAGPKVPTAGGVPNRAGLTGGIFQDPDVIGQQVGDYTPIPTTYSQGGETIDLDPNFGGGFDNSPVTPEEKARLSILNDPQYISGLSAFNTFLQTNRNRTRDMIRQAIIGAGWDPRGKAGELGFNLSPYGDAFDEGTLQQALANPYSGRAQLEQGRQGQMKNLMNSLAARNMVRSGAAATGSTRVENAYQSAVNQQLGGLLSAIQSRGTEGNTAESQAWADWNRTRGEIAQRLGTSSWA